MLLSSVCPVASKENGFFITDLKDKSELFFQDSDDFYERPFAKYLMNREVIWIEAKNNHLNIIIK